MKEKEKNLKFANETINKLKKIIRKEKVENEEKIAPLVTKIIEPTEETDNLKKKNEECKTLNKNSKNNEDKNSVNDFSDSIIIANEEFQSEIILLKNKINTLEISFNCEK